MERERRTFPSRRPSRAADSQWSSRAADWQWAEAWGSRPWEPEWAKAGSREEDVAVPKLDPESVTRMHERFADFFTTGERARQLVALKDTGLANVQDLLSWDNCWRCSTVYWACQVRCRRGMLSIACWRRATVGCS